MSNNFEIIKDMGDWKLIRTSCECLSDDHIMVVDIDADKECGVSLELDLTLTPKALISNIGNNKFFSRLRTKLELIIKIIFNKDISYTEGFIFRGPEHIHELCDYLKEQADFVYGKEKGE